MKDVQPFLLASFDARFKPLLGKITRQPGDPPFPEQIMLDRGAEYLRDDKAWRAFGMWETALAPFFGRGVHGFELYRACSQIVLDVAPAEHAEFLRRFSERIDIDAASRVLEEEMGGASGFADALLKAMEDETNDLRKK